MAHPKTLSERQVALLRWIGAGCPSGVMEGEEHRISAAALRRRQLVTITGRGPTWSARITEAGRAYLARVDGPEAPVPRQASTSVTQQLVDAVIAAGGSLRVPRRSWPRRGQVDYEQRARLAMAYGKVPGGKRLAVRVASPEELEIELVDAGEDAGAPRPVSVPATVGRYHPVVREFRERADRHEVSRAALPRALRILHALIVEAERRGYRAELATTGGDSYGRESRWTGVKHGHIVMTVDGCQAAVRVTEDGLPSRTHWEDKHATYSYTRGAGSSRRLPPLREYEAGATGRLCLQLVTGFGGYGRPAKWADRQSWALEDKLPELLHELELRAVEQREREQEAARRAAQRERLKQEVLARARERYAEHRRGEALRAQAAGWQLAEQIRAYCDAVEAAHPSVPETSAWIAWARGYADAQDPLRTPPAPPATPESVPDDELRSFIDQADLARLRGW